METNCRKLVSACVQLGKSSFLLLGSLEGRQPASCESGEKAPARQRGPQQLERSPGGLRRKRNQTSTALAFPLRGGLGSGELALTLLKADHRVAQGQITALTGLPGGPRAGRAVRPSSNGLFALCPSFPSVPPRPLTLARGSLPLPFGIRCHRTCGGLTNGPGVQPATVECLFSKDSEIKKVEFTDSPESRKEAASSKLFPRQHPGANGKGEGSAGRAPGSCLRDSGQSVKNRRAKPPKPVSPAAELRLLASG